MARPLRIEKAGGLYHVINRGNYRAAIFEAETTKASFMTCLGEACERTGWVVHAWCLMSNHYHLAIETPQPNLVTGMQWLQSTFALRFNGFRDERGHLFQGRYHSLMVEPEGLGAVCHYIHLNPVRARLCPIDGLADYPWSSYRWLMQPRQRLAWYRPQAALTHAGGLADTPTGRQKYAAYLAWLATNEPAQKELRFAQMCQGWNRGRRLLYFQGCRPTLQAVVPTVPAAALQCGSSRDGRGVVDRGHDPRETWWPSVGRGGTGVRSDRLLHAWARIEPAVLSVRLVGCAAGGTSMSWQRTPI